MRRFLFDWVEGGVNEFEVFDTFDFVGLKSLVGLNEAVLVRNWIFLGLWLICSSLHPGVMQLPAIL